MRPPIRNLIYYPAKLKEKAEEFKDKGAEYRAEWDLFEKQCTRNPGSIGHPKDYEDGKDYKTFPDHEGGRMNCRSAAPDNTSELQSLTVAFFLNSYLIKIIDIKWE